MDTVKRNLKEIGISAEIKELVGVFSMRFPKHPQKRHDLSICYRARWRRGEPKANRELTRFNWIHPEQIPSNIGANYRRMILTAFPLDGVTKKQPPADE